MGTSGELRTLLGEYKAKKEELAQELIDAGVVPRPEMTLTEMKEKLSELWGDLNA